MKDFVFICGAISLVCNILIILITVYQEYDSLVYEVKNKSHGGKILTIIKLLLGLVAITIGGSLVAWILNEIDIEI